MKEMKEVLSEFCGMQESLTASVAGISVCSVNVYKSEKDWLVELTLTKFDRNNQITDMDKVMWFNYCKIHEEEDEAKNEERVEEFMRRNAL